MKRDRFAGRYIIKIGSSVLLVFLNLIPSFILPRAFSVEQYGFYTFNLSVFTNIVGIANLQASSALSAKYSKRNSEVGIVKFYLAFFFIMSVVLMVGLIILYPIEYVRDSLGGQSLLVVLLGMEAAILNKLLTDTITVYDSIAVTRFPALMQIVLKICMSVFVIVTFVSGFLDIIVFYLGQSVIFIIIIALLLRLFFNDSDKTYETVTDLGWKEYLKEFYFFCRPLVLVSMFAMILSIIMDVTLLNNQGPETRAMYGVSTQFNSLIVYVFNPYAELSKREYAVRANDPIVLKEYVVQSAKTIMWLTSYFAVFIALMSDKIVPFIFGDSYIYAVPTVIIMMGYTIYQSWGQLLGAYLIALEKTRVSAVISLISQILLLLGTLAFIFPNSLWENGFGAEGMALARLLSCCIGVLIEAVWIAKDIGYSTVKINLIRIGSIFILSVFCCCSKIIICILNNYVCIDNGVFIFLCGVLYSIGVILLIMKQPLLIGFTKEQIQTNIASIKARINRTRNNLFG